MHSVKKSHRRRSNVHYMPLEVAALPLQASRLPEKVASLREKAATQALQAPSEALNVAALAVEATRMPPRDIDPVRRCLNAASRVSPRRPVRT